MIKEYYNENAESFVENTLNADMANLYDRFEKYFIKDNSILDLGCGSGRDSLYFKNQGYIVTALDYSEKLAKSASKLIGQEVLVKDMREISYVSKFHGIWACASVLHINRIDINMVMKNCARALKDEGVFYLSFKYGDREEMKNGRYFNFYNEESFRQLIKKVGGFKILEMFKTTDVRPGREGEYWLNIIMKKI
ncbi:MAG: class I SAM-dependent methyltransferase [Anaeromicrobium sp.]|jgi:SAM-dependent methyltransferase|uniref:class I SAM-dependent DNA methyltransferase n=1 Tax=Anaeromicrobium sp. TaxID=1929132 RepID=UPI0025EAF2B3|nr:class I SAM-dependent methyltransferase [Anaeromicrobium sp.]MCT4592794.1 class I SAM-dependent methyltransferase [Anaeromicrobium sp.]